jgi:hypothetical protein
MTNGIAFHLHIVAAQVLPGFFPAALRVRATQAKQQGAAEQAETLHGLGSIGRTLREDARL